jgi:hypothetical protein
MDANKNMTNGHMERMLSSKDIGMRPVTLKNHPDLPLTPTYMRGLQPGWVPVDEVWVTDDLLVDMAGWLAVHKCPGNHRIIILEIDTKALLGDDLLQITRPPCTMPLLSNPKDKEKLPTPGYLTLPETPSPRKTSQGLCHLNNIPLDRTRTRNGTNRPNTERRDVVHQKKNCRKLAMGEVDFLPELNKAQQ